MHKKALSLLVTTTVAASLLFGEVWESNALSMRLKPVTEIPKTGYYLVTDENSESLYLDGNPVCRKEFTSNGFRITGDGMEIIYTLDDEKRPVRIETEETVIQNTYSDTGLLTSSTTTAEDGLETITLYHWSPEGILMLVEEVDLSYYLPSTRFHYTAGEDTYGLNSDTPDVFIERLDERRSQVEVLDDKVKLLVADGTEKTFSKDGLLIHELRDGVSYDYSYTDGILSETMETNGRNVTKLSYDDGVLLSREYTLDGVTTRRQLFEPDGTMIEERYRNGKPYARVYYDKDHKTVRSIESL